MATSSIQCLNYHDQWRLRSAQRGKRVSPILCCHPWGPCEEGSRSGSSCMTRHGGSCVGGRIVRCTPSPVGLTAESKFDSLERFVGSRGSGVPSCARSTLRAKNGLGV